MSRSAITEDFSWNSPETKAGLAAGPDTNLVTQAVSQPTKQTYKKYMAYVHRYSAAHYAFGPTNIGHTYSGML